MKCNKQIYVTYNNDDELYYLRNNIHDHAVILYKNNVLLDKVRIYYDAEEDDRNYIVINYTITYLDTLKSLRPVNHIIDKICQEYGITVKDLQSPSRVMDIVEARHVLFYILREKYKMPLEKIGELFGSRTHATVISGIKKIEGYCQVRKHYREHIQYTLNLAYE